MEEKPRSKPAPTRVRIRDFQSIEDLSIDVAGFTCVTGPTNIGKSAMVRAMSSALLNKSVVGLVRKGKKFCTVEVDGLKWEKGERVGRYWVPGEQDENGNPKPRDGIGQGQTEVTELMGYRAVKVGDKYITPWLAVQFNPVFLMDDSGPAVTDFISDIAHLKVLQDAIVHCTRNRQRLLTSLKEKEEELGRLEAKDQALSGLDNLLRAERDLVAQAESLEDCGRAIARLKELIARTEEEQRAIDVLSAASEVKVPKKPADPAESLMPGAVMWQEMESIALRLSPIKGVAKVVVPDPLDTEGVESLRRHSELLAIPGLKASVALLGKAEKVSVPGAPEVPLEALRDDLKAVREAARVRSEISALQARLSVLDEVPVPDSPDPSALAGLKRGCELAKDIGAARARLAALDAQADSLDRDIEEVEAELASIPRCPTCDQVWAPQHAHA